MGVRADPGSFRWCQALSRSRSFATTILSDFIRINLLFLIITINGNPLTGQQDAVHITAILGESVIFNCHVEFPGDHPVPYVLQWEKKVSDTGTEIPIYIWYENYPTHSGEGYEGRVSRVSSDSQFGVASLNLTNIRETDQGWYECKVVFLNRSPNQHKNGTWFHLDVHAPPRFSVTPEDIIYVNLGDSIILNCQADGTPTPEILWYKDAHPVDPSSTVGIFNDGTELRISTIRTEDIGDYTCIARNGEGQVSHTARVIIAGGAVIMVPPSNQTKLEGEKAIFTCEAKAMPGNVTVRWFREGAPVREVSALETRLTIRKDGSLIINPVSADDSGQYLCEVSNGIGDPQSATAYLNVEYPAKVTFTPTVQYLPFRLAGVVQCYIKSNPPLQYVTWTKDKRLLEPYQTKDIVIMNNGSLLFTRVNQNHQGRYTCTPYNAQGTQGSSGPMEVLVRKPPVFVVEPDNVYQRKIGESVEMHCDAQEAEGTQRPNIQWQRNNGVALQRNRVKSFGGNITIENLTISDYGIYQCVASNEVATITSATQLIIEGTQPHAPYNITGTATESSVTINWMPGYSGGSDYKQNYTIWYREGGVSDWSPIPVTPSGSTQVTIKPLSSGTTYEFQVVGKNELGVGMMSKVITIRTLDAAKQRNVKSATPTVVPTNSNTFKLMPDEAEIINFHKYSFPTDSTGSVLFPPIFRPKGPKPGQPRNLTVTEIANGFLISWQQPLERIHLIQHYTIKYRTDAHWKTLNRGQIRPEETSYLVKNLVGGRTYHFRVLANSGSSYESSDEVKFPVPASVKHKAITAGVVGGILFFIVAIILSICAVKICNKRKRRKQEKAYNMVACRITDARNSTTATTTTTTTATIIKTGSGSSNSQVPLKKFRKIRIPGVKILSTILHWIWPPDRCTNCQSIYSITPYNNNNNNNQHQSQKSTSKNLDHIHRSADGRFVLSGHHGSTSTYDYQTNIALSGGHDGGRGGITHNEGIDTVDGISVSDRINMDGNVENGGRSSSNSNVSSSDDGGFIQKRNQIIGHIKSWRRPLVTYPSQTSFRSDDSSMQYGQNYRQNIVHGLIHSVGNSSRGGESNVLIGNDRNRQQQLLRKVPVEYHHHHHHYHHHQLRHQHPVQPTVHINTISENVPGPMVPTPYTPSRVSRIISSSPAVSSTTGAIMPGIATLRTALDPNFIGEQNGDGGGVDSSVVWSPHTMYFSDLSSVTHPSSAERSLNKSNSRNTNITQLRYLQERYSQELPSLRAIHEETQRMAQGFIPVQIQQQNQQQHHQQYPMHSPTSPSSLHNFSNQFVTIPEEQILFDDNEDDGQMENQPMHPQQPQPQPHQLQLQPHQSQIPQSIINQNIHRHRTRLLAPRRLQRNMNEFGISSPTLRSPFTVVDGGGSGGVLPTTFSERSPAEESRSSSSGFGSKNTSNTQQNQSSQSAGSTTIEWRHLPPYRPPPPPPTSQKYQQNPLTKQQQEHQRHQTLSPSILLQLSSSSSMSVPQQLSPAQTQLNIQLSAQQLQQQQQQQKQQQQLQQQQQQHTINYGTIDSISSQNNSPYSMDQWFDLINRLNGQSDIVSLPKAVDVGSVDGHYEFDPATPTPTASTPTGPRDDQFMTTILNTTGSGGRTLASTTTTTMAAATMSSGITGRNRHPEIDQYDIAAQHQQQQLQQSELQYQQQQQMLMQQDHYQSQSQPQQQQQQHQQEHQQHDEEQQQQQLQQRKSRTSKYDNIEARVQAMKEEFYAYRRRQAMRRAGVVELESAC